MKLLLDNNLCYRLVAALLPSYPQSEHIRNIGLSTAEDEAIWDYARQHGFVIVIPIFTTAACC